MPFRTILCLHDLAPFIAPAADDAALAAMIEALDDLDTPPLPKDFAIFLGQANGFVWQGIEIFGSSPIVVEALHSIVPDIVAINESYHGSYEELRACLIIGRSEDDLYVFNSCNGQYAVIDRKGFEPVQIFPDFTQLLQHIINERV